MCMRHVTSGCAMSHMDASCHIPIRHVPYECVCNTRMSHVTRHTCRAFAEVNQVTYESFIFTYDLSHVTHEWVMSQMQGLWGIESYHSWIRIRHVTYGIVTSHINGSCHTCRAFEDVMRLQIHAYTTRQVRCVCECVCVWKREREREL